MDVFGFARVFSREDPANNSSITALFPPTYVFVDGRRFGAIAEPTHYEKNSMKRTLQNHDFLGNFSFKMYEEINQDCEEISHDPISHVREYRDVIDSDNQRAK